MSSIKLKKDIYYFNDAKYTIAFILIGGVWIAIQWDRMKCV